MEKLFLPYALALELKNLGFNEPCLFDYNRWNTERLNDSYFNYVNYNKGETMVSAPLFQQVFKWFREKYKLECYPMLDTEDIYWCLFTDGVGSGYLLKDGDYGHCSDEHLEFKTYEEAELECIKKLIEISKNK